MLLGNQPPLELGRATAGADGLVAKYTLLFVLLGDCRARLVEVG